MAPHRTPFGGPVRPVDNSRQRPAHRALVGRVVQYGPRCAEDSYTPLAWTLATGAAVTLSWWGVHTVMSGTAYDPPRALPDHGGRRRPRRQSKPQASSHGSRPPTPVARRAPSAAGRRARRPRRPPDPPPSPPTTSRPSASAADGRVRAGEGLRHSTAAGSVFDLGDDLRRRWSSATPGAGWRMQVWKHGDVDPGGRSPGTGRGVGVLHLARPSAARGDRRPSCRSSDRRDPEPAVRRPHAERPTAAAPARRTAAASVTGAAPPVKSVSARPCSTRPGCGSDAARRVSSATGSGWSEATQHGVAEALAAQHGRVGDQRELREDGRPRWRSGRADGRAAGRRRGWRRSSRRASATRRTSSRNSVARQMRGGAGPAEHVRDDEVRPAVRHLGEPVAGVDGPDPDPGARVQRQLPADQLDEGRVELDDLLGGAGAGGGDVAGEGEGARRRGARRAGAAGRARRDR